MYLEIGHKSCAIENEKEGEREKDLIIMMWKEGFASKKERKKERESGEKDVVHPHQLSSAFLKFEGLKI